GRPQVGVLVHFQAVADLGRLDRRPVTEVSHLTDPNGEARVLWAPDAAAIGTVSLDVSIPALPSLASVRVASRVAGAAAPRPPAVLAPGPTDGSSGILAGTQLFLRFNQDMDTTSLKEHVHVTANGGEVTGKLRFDTHARDVFFRPAEALPFLATCVFTVTAG